MRSASRAPGTALALTLLVPLLLACPRAPQPGDPLGGLTADQQRSFEQGRVIFNRVFTEAAGVGPLSNAPGCAVCHSTPVPGGGGAITEIHATVFAGGACDNLLTQGGPVYQQVLSQALRNALGITTEPIPPQAQQGIRSTPDVFGFGLLDAVPESVIVAMADPNDANGDGISGRLNRFFDGRVGRFGRKALVPTLAEFNEGAFQVEQGITTPNVPDEGTVGGTPIPPGVDPVPDPEIDAQTVALTNAYVSFLAPPARQSLSGEAGRGESIFEGIGCTACHVPRLRTGNHPVAALANKEVQAYTDFLLHDMGPDLADICFGLVATPAEFRTEPLMGLRLATRFLHDGRATSVEQAIELHGGEGAASRDRFRQLSTRDKSALMAFLRAL